MAAAIREQALSTLADQRTLVARPNSALASLDLQRDLDISPCRVRVGADLFMRFARQFLQFLLRKTWVHYEQFHGKPESASRTGTDRDTAANRSVFGVLLLLGTDII